MIYKASEFKSQEVSLDGNTFAECVFKDCQLVYQGGTPPNIINCKLEATQFEFREAAANTVAFMNALHNGGFSVAVDELVKAIQTTFEKVPKK